MAMLKLQSMNELIACRIRTTGTLILHGTSQFRMQVVLTGIRCGRVSPRARKLCDVRGEDDRGMKQLPAVTKGCLMEVRGAHYPLT